MASMTAVARRKTISTGTQTPPFFVEALSSTQTSSAITSTSPSTGVSVFPPLSVSAAAPTPLSEVPQPSVQNSAPTGTETPAKAPPSVKEEVDQPEEATTPASTKTCHHQAKDISDTSATSTAAATTASTNGSSSGAAIFSPKSAAVALSSLFTSNPAANPRQCFPSSTGASAYSGAASSGGATGMVPVAAVDKPPSPSVMGTNAVNSATEASPSNMPPVQQQQPLPPYLAAQQQQRPPPPTPHNNHGSPPGVFFGGYPPYQGPPHPWGRPGPPPPHHHHHPNHHLPQQAPSPWGTPMHVGSKMNPMTQGPSPPQTGGFMWQGGHGPAVMEQPGTMVYHHHHNHHPPYGHPPLAVMKDGSDPNSAVRLASNNTSLVTPTPKKAKMTDPRQMPFPGMHLHQQRPPVGPPPTMGVDGMHHPSSAAPTPTSGYNHANNTQGPHPSAVLSQQQQQPMMQQQLNHHHKHSKPPTPPQDPASYSRKKKSLGVLAENFLQRYENCKPGTEIIVDEAAVDLGVERRRIYDVVNILESIQLVVKKGKNTYSWLGKEYLPDIFGKLQVTAVTDYPEDAKKYGLLAGEEDPDASKNDEGVMSRRNSMSSIASDDSKNSFRSLAKLSQQFLQVFLVGHDILSLPFASELIQGSLSKEEYAKIGSAHAHMATRYDPNAPAPPSLENPLEFRRAAQRGLKTKIRRLYDIANVFLSVGLLRKVDTSTAASTIDALSSNRRPNFQWAYCMSPKEIQERFLSQQHHNQSLLHLLPTSALALAQAGVYATDERTPLRAIMPQPSQWSSDKKEVVGSATETTPIASGSKALPDNGEESNETTPAGESLGAPSDNAENGSRLLANIHQSGGAFNPSYRATPPGFPPTTPGLLSRLVTLPTQKQRAAIATASTTASLD